MIKLVLTMLFMLVAIFYFIAMINIISSGKLFGKTCHKIFKWHLPNENIKISGINLVSTCKYCGRKIIKCHSDWFADDFLPATYGDYVLQLRKRGKKND